MAVIDEIYVRENGTRKPIDSLNNEMIEEIVIEDQLYHFAKEKEVEGIDSLELDNAVEEPLKSLEVMGDTFQQKYSGKNLFNYKDYTKLIKTSGGDITSSYLTINDDLFYIKLDIYNTSAYLECANKFELPAGTYTISGKCKDSEIGKVYCGVRWSDTSRKADYRNVTPIDGEWSSFYYTFTISEKKTLEGVYLLDTGTDLSSNICFTNIQLEKGSAASTYEQYVGGVASPNPDYPQDIVSVGDYDEASGKYKIPITVRGKNYFNLSGMPATNIEKSLFIEDGKVRVIKYGNLWCTPKDFLSINGLKAGDTITTTLKYEVLKGMPNAATGSISFVPKNSALHPMIYLYGYTSKGTITIPDYFTDDNYFGVYIYGANVDEGNGREVIFSEIQIEKGTVATEYEPYREPVTANIYLKTPLFKGSNNQLDKLDVLNGKVIRRFKSHSLSSETMNIFDYSSGGTTYGYVVRSPGTEAATDYLTSGYTFAYHEKFLNNRVTTINSTIEGMYVIGYNFASSKDFLFYVLSNSISTIEELREILDGTKIFYYIIRDYIEEFEVPEEIKTALSKGTNIIEIQTNDLKPSATKVSYWRQIVPDE